MEKSNFFSYAGFHFKLCSIELRELFSKIFESTFFAESIRKHLPKIKEFVPLYTCNRFDLCLFGETNRNEICNLFFDLVTLQTKNLALHADSINMPSYPYHGNLMDHISKSLRFASDEEGLNLFLKVSASLDSLILGETQILGQIKSAFAYAKQKNYAGKMASGIFDHCFKVSKRVRNETNLFKNIISIGHLVVEFAKKEFNNLTDKRIVIFGAGEMALLTAKNFISHGSKNISIANRTYVNAEKLCQKIQFGTPLTLKDAIKNINAFDICITACSGENILLEKHHFCSNNEGLKKSHLLIDISMPRKINHALLILNHIKLVNIDDLSTIIEQNKESRKNELIKAEQIISNETEKFFEKQKKRKSNTQITEFNCWLHQIVKMEADRFLRQKTKQKSTSLIARSVCKRVHARLSKQHTLRDK